MYDLTDGNTVYPEEEMNEVGHSDSKVKPFTFVIFYCWYCRRRRLFQQDASIENE